MQVKTALLCYHITAVCTQGNVTCCSEECGDAEKFIIQYHVDGSGRWAICNRVTGYYFGGTDDKLLCYEKQPGPSEWWTVHLAVHPQVRSIVIQDCV